MRVLITGVSGFAGQWLARELAKDRRLELYGISRTKPAPGILPPRLKFYACDLLSPRLSQILKSARPDRVHHLAGQASVGLSWQDPERTRRENTEGTRRLLGALTAAGLTPAFHLAGSAEVYGRQRRARVRESDRPAPRSPYAKSKLEQERLVLAYGRTTGAPVVITRAFNHAGPGQKERFALSNFARQIARIEAGLDEPVLKVGNLSAVRDFADVRDVARAYRKSIETAGGPAVYNVATGRGRTLESAVRALVAMARVPVRVRRDPSRMRREDVPRLVGDPSALRRATGWRPAIKFKKTLNDTLRYWRAQVRARSS